MPVLGVKIAELKKLQRQIKKDYSLSLELYNTGIYDVQYLAGLIADETRMTKKDLKHWLAKGNCPAITASIVAWVAAESSHGHELALKWIDSMTENTAHTGWETLSSLVAITDDSSLDVPELKRLLKRVEQTIHQQQNHVRYGMNDFVIAVGSYVADLTETAIATGEAIGMVNVDMGETACKVPSAVTHIRKAQQRGTIGKKRKEAKCSAGIRCRTVTFQVECNTAAHFARISLRKASWSETLFRRLAAPTARWHLDFITAKMAPLYRRPADLTVCAELWRMPNPFPFQNRLC